LPVKNADPLDGQSVAKPFQIETLWLDDERGTLSDWITQRWVQYTGRRVNLKDDPWIDGPLGEPTGVGPDFFQEYAAHHGLAIATADVPRGLLVDFEALAGPGFDPSTVDPEIARFYEETSEYELDLWSEWSPLFRPFGWLVALLFSRRLQQLNVPISSLDTARGVTSRIVQVVRADGGVAESAWVRQLVSSGLTLYAGSYSPCRIPCHEGPVVRIVFPLPHGNATVLMAPESRSDGSFVISSSGSPFGGPGFYFFVSDSEGSGWAKHLPTLREAIHVYRADGGLRADHTFVLWRRQFMKLHYRIRRKASPQAVAPVRPRPGSD